MRRIPIWMIVASALIIQSIAARFQWYFLDVMMVPVIYSALKRNCLSAMFTGASAGMLEDALSGGLFGLHGFGKTLAAYVAHWASRYLLVEWPAVRLLVFLGCYGLEGLTVPALEVLLEGQEWDLSALGIRMGVSTGAGLLAYLGLERLDRRLERRRGRL